MMNESKVVKNNGIFIVGCPRSGTTLLQSVLTSHSAIASFPESKFFLHLVAQPDARSRRFALGLVTPRLRPSLEEFLEQVDHPEMKAMLPKLPFIKLYVKRFQAILDRLTELQGKTLWLEKTPDHLRALAYIERYIPEAKIIHLVRNGADVIASIYDLTQRFPERWGCYYKDLGACIRRWQEDIEISRRYLGRPNHLLVRYEAFVSQPEVEVQRICSFIGVEFESAMLEGYRTTSRSLIRNHEVWKAGTQQPIENANTHKFQTILTSDQQEQVLQAISGIVLPTLSPTLLPTDGGF